MALASPFLPPCCCLPFCCCFCCFCCLAAGCSAATASALVASAERPRRRTARLLLRCTATDNHVEPLQKRQTSLRFYVECILQAAAGRQNVTSSAGSASPVPLPRVAAQQVQLPYRSHCMVHLPHAAWHQGPGGSGEVHSAPPQLGLHRALPAATRYLLDRVTNSTGLTDNEATYKQHPGWDIAIFGGW